MDVKKTKTLLNNWIQAIQTEDPKQVIPLYDKTAILVPTLSNKVCNTQEKIKAYFDHFLQKKPKCTINECHIQTIESLGIASGIYTFTVQDQTTVQARYSFVFSLQTTKILNHHSSMMPES